MRAPPRPGARIQASLLLAAGVLLAGCAPSDPAQRVLKERARWTVQPLEWVQLDDGAVQIGTRISGPPNSKLAALTVRIDLMDAAGARIESHWYTFDLTAIPRGGPKDVPVRLPPVDQPVDSVQVQLVLEPTEEEATHIRELQGLP